MYVSLYVCGYICFILQGRGRYFWREKKKVSATAIFLKFFPGRGGGWWWLSQIFTHPILINLIQPILNFTRPILSYFAFLFLLTQKDFLILASFPWQRPKTSVKIEAKKIKEREKIYVIIKCRFMIELCCEWVSSHSWMKSRQNRILSKCEGYIRALCKLQTCFIIYYNSFKTVCFRRVLSYTTTSFKTWFRRVLSYTTTSSKTEHETDVYNFIQDRTSYRRVLTRISKQNKVQTYINLHYNFI